MGDKPCGKVKGFLSNPQGWQASYQTQSPRCFLPADTSRTAIFLNAQKNLPLTTSAAAKHPVAPMPGYADPHADRDCVPDPVHGGVAAPLEAKTHTQPPTFISVSPQLWGDGSHNHSLFFYSIVKV